jgi:hypothetical protein
MITLFVLAAVLLAPSVILLVKGPGEIDLVTRPKNLGVLGAEIVRRPLAKSTPAVAVAVISDDEIVAGIHESNVPAGMRAQAANV